MPETQPLRPLPGILAEIVEAKRHEVDELRGREGALEAAAAGAPAPRDFAAALRGGETVALIAECKRRSPGAGPIRPDLDPSDLAGLYAEGGAAALSVLTDGPFFGGSADDLASARGSATLPVLRKDFTLDALQVLEARAMGADAVLLIVRILDDARLAELLAFAASLGMAALVEAHDADEVDRALAAGAEIIGINNRDLATFRTDLSTTLQLAERVPERVVLVSESGIRSPEEVARLASGGVHAVLVGETLLRAENPREAAAALAAVPRSPSG